MHLERVQVIFNDSEFLVSTFKRVGGRWQLIALSRRSGSQLRRMCPDSSSCASTSKISFTFLKVCQTMEPGIKNHTYEKNSLPQKIQSTLKNNLRIDAFAKTYTANLYFQNHIHSSIPTNKT